MDSLWSEPSVSLIVSRAGLSAGEGLERLTQALLMATNRDVKVSLLPETDLDEAEIEEVLAMAMGRRQAMADESDATSDAVKLFECLAVAAEHKDNETGRHNRRIGRYASILASAMQWPPERCRLIELAASLHDIGKIGIPDDILFKPTPLTLEERVRMEDHTIAGHRILSAARAPVLECAANIARHHHERWDGSGYPFGLRGRAIPFEARIVAVCDVYDAIRSRRPYKPALTHDEACDALLHGDGRTSPDHFDPTVMAAFRRTKAMLDETFHKMGEA
jgi:putative two-component system response regulator